MKKLVLFLVIFLLSQNVFATPAVTILSPQTIGQECNPKDFNFFQNYRAFWSYVSKKKPSGYPSYWTLVPETYVTGYGGSLCKNVIIKGYAKINYGR